MTVINQTLADYIARERARKEIGKTKWPSRRKKEVPMLISQYVVEAVRKGGKTITTQPRPLAQAQRRFAALKKLNGSTGTVAATLYREYRGGSRRMIETWASPEMPVRREGPSIMKQASPLFVKPLFSPGMPMTTKNERPTLTVHSMGHVYRRQDAALAIAELFRIAANKNMRMVGMRLVKQVLREYGGGAVQLPELLPKYFEIVTKKATEAALELQGSEPVNMTTNDADLTFDKKVEATGPYKAVADQINASRHAAAQIQNRIIGKGYTSPKRAELVRDAADGPRPLFELYFRLKALADCLSSNPVLVKLAADARATDSMDEFDRKAHRACREMANLMQSSVRFKIRAQFERDSYKRTSVTAALERIRDLIGKVGDLTRGIDFGVNQRLRAAAMAREALVIWTTAMSAVPYKTAGLEPPPFQASWMEQ